MRLSPAAGLVAGLLLASTVAGCSHDAKSQAASDARAACATYAAAVAAPPSATGIEPKISEAADQAARAAKADGSWNALAHALSIYADDLGGIQEQLNSGMTLEQWGAEVDRDKANIHAECRKANA